MEAKAGTAANTAANRGVSLKGLAVALPGIAACLLIALIAWYLGRRFAIIGGPVFAILLGILAGNAIGLPASARPGVLFCSKKVLQYAIIMLGGSLSLVQVLKTGRESLAVMLITLGAALIFAFLLGRLLRVGGRLTTLVGVGTAICGGSAIAAVAPIIEADDGEIAFAISTVFLFNVVAVLIFPPLGHALGMSDNGFGLWAGTAINDTSSVVAAGYSYSRAAGDFATITKLARTTMIIPISLIIAFACAGKGTDCRLGRVMPWFVLGFLAASLLNTAGLLGGNLPALMGGCGRFMIIVALAGVGLGSSIRNMIKTGPRPILLGLLVWIIVALTSLAVQGIAGQIR